MEALAGYGSDEEEVMTPALLPRTSLNTAPTILTIHNPQQQQRLAAIDHKTNTLIVNSKIDIVLAPMSGPVNPFKFNPTMAGAAKRIGMGAIEEMNMEDWSFNEQYQTYQKSGYAIDATSNAVLGDVNQFVSNNGNVASYTKKSTSKDSSKRKRGELLPENLGDESAGPWAIIDAPKDAYQLALEQFQQSQPLPEVTVLAPQMAAEPIVEVPMNPRVHILEPEESEVMWEKVNERKMGLRLPPRPSRGSSATEAKSTYHGPPGSERDYQGRPWTTPPPGVRAHQVPCEERHESFIPKKCIKKYTGHTKGVQAVLFLPGTGHLLLSASMDGKCKIWDVATDRNVKRTYIGHSEAVRAIDFTSKGTHFASSGFDRYVNVWDVETGQVTGIFSNRKMGYDVKFHPEDDNVFLVAASDNRVYQWDVRTGAVSQEYNYHLQPCNTITFFERGRKFVSTSDDKKVLVWEYDIPVPIKYIQEPDLHSLPAVTLHPSEDYFVGQSMDNTIVTYECGERVRQIKKKTFRGHNNAGYACKVDFSPNGKFMMSGEGGGKVTFWDWKTLKMLRSFQAHENGPCIGSAWHPLSPSIVATCGWDGLIKLWD